MTRERNSAVQFVTGNANFVGSFENEYRMFIGRYSECVHCSHIRKTVGIRLANERKSRVLFGSLLFHVYLNFVRGDKILYY